MRLLTTPAPLRLVLNEPSEGTAQIHVKIHSKDVPKAVGSPSIETLILRRLSEQLRRRKSLCRVCCLSSPKNVRFWDSLRCLSR